MKNQFDLTGKVAIVTGGNKGLGEGIALGLAEAGAKVVIVSRKGGENTVDKIKSLNREAIFIPADLSSLDPIGTIISGTLEAFGRVDILVNNAGMIRRNDSLEFSEKDWDDVMNLNIKSLFFLSQAVAKKMVEQGDGGKIINIASMLSYQGGIRVPSYTASKGGVKQLTMLLANEWAPHGINVNAIAPGYMATDNTEDLQNDEARNREILGRIPVGRWGKPEDLSGPAVFLSSSASDYVNGFTIAVDGGWLSR